MTKADEAHLGRVIDGAVKRITKKYRRGVEEHGGHLPAKAGMLANAEMESDDLVVYLSTMREQLEEALRLLEQGDVAAAAEILRRVVGKPED